MSGNSFAFPPPPPPPPQAAETQYTPIGYTFSRGRGDKRWERGSRGRGRGNTNRGSRGGSQHFGGNTLHEVNHNVNIANQYGGGSYPLPNYPPVQQPQYPPDARNTYSNPPSLYHQVSSQPGPHQANQNYPTAYPNTQPQSGPYTYAYPGYYPQAQQHHSYQPQAPISHSDHRYASHPVAMGPPIRLGFGDQQGMDQRINPYNHHDQADSGMNHYSSHSMPLYREGSSCGSRGGRQHSPHRQGRGRGHGRGRGQANRRGNPDAANAINSSSRKTQVAPAVPSFGNPLPLKPPIPQMEEKKPSKKKKRRVNQLGLTPTNNEHVSSSEEEDVDEESKLATAVGAAGIAGQQLEFTYRGQTSTLQSSSDIASWIEERKKRFPTAARKAENDTRLEKLRHEREQKREVKKQTFESEKLLKRQLKTLERDKQAATEKAKLKVEKLRRKLEKEERRIAKAEAKSAKRNAPEAENGFAHGRKRKRSQSDPILESGDDQSESLERYQPIKSFEEGSNLETTQIAESDPAPSDNSPSGEISTTLEKIKEEEPPNLITGPLTPTSQPSVLEQEAEPDSRLPTEDSKIPDQARRPTKEFDGPDVYDAGPLLHEAEAVDALSTASSDMALSSEETLDGIEDDETSSSGSSSVSDTDSEVPEATTSRQLGSRKVPPPRRNNKQDKAICRDFLKTGRCRRGKRCRWQHALPDRKQKKAAETILTRPERKSLHQRLLEQQEENERAEKKKKAERQNHDTKDDTQVTAARTD